MSSISLDLLKRRKEAEMMALEILPLPKNPKKKTLSIIEKNKILDIFIHYGIPPTLGWLLIAGLGIKPTKLGRSADLQKRELIMQFFLKRHGLPTKRSKGQKGRRKKDDPDCDIISQCVKELEIQLPILRNTENPQNLIKALLNDPDFIEEFEQRIEGRYLAPLGKLVSSYVSGDEPKEFYERTKLK